MNHKGFVIMVLLLMLVIVYLFVNAPPPLADQSNANEVKIPIMVVFRILEAENDIARSVWTREIVKQGKKQGLKFSEHWRDKNTEAGPLPALFLRATAKNFERSPLRLSLFLGSDFPISMANAFSDGQLEKYRQLKTTLEPQFFFQEDIQRYTVMFTDIASSEACIDCHNEHQDSPKSDWQLQDVMGATTWMHPHSSVSLTEAMQLLNLLRQSIKQAYSSYLEKVSSFATPPIIGKKWPKEGYYLPEVAVFMQAIEQQASSVSLNQLLLSSIRIGSKNQEIGDEEKI